MEFTQQFYPRGPSALAGYTITESIWCTIPQEREAMRSWRERLFSRPWQPFRRTKIETIQVPNPDLFIAGTRIVGHPATIQRLMDSLIQD